MQIPHLNMLRCPKCKKNLRIAEVNEQQEGLDNGSLICEKGHQWPVIKGIPSLLHPPLTEQDKKWIDEYDAMAEGYDEAVLQYNEWLGIDLKEERKGFTQFIPIEGPATIIDVSVGTAGNFEALAEVYPKQLGRFNLHGLDVSWGMLHVAQRKSEKLDLGTNFVNGSVFNIPYPKNTFDIVLHTGGINTFSDIAKAMIEMLRIVKKDGFVIIVDEGISPKIRGTERGDAIVKANSLFDAKPPLEHIPNEARDVEVSYVMNEAFYQLVFRK